MRQFFGKYRGTVLNNVDPMLLGRLQVSVPAVHGLGLLIWALPCVPYAGSGVGLYAMPPIGANVWVEFEAGDPDKPVWVGCFWGTGELPTTTLGLPTVKVWKTDTAMIKLDDTPGTGGITVETGIGKVTLTATGVEVTYGKNKVSLNAVSVSVNDGALEVI